MDDHSCFELGSRRIPQSEHSIAERRAPMESGAVRASLGILP